MIDGDSHETSRQILTRESFGGYHLSWWLRAAAPGGIGPINIVTNSGGA